MGINSRNIDDLLPEVAAKCRAFLEKCAAAGLTVKITSTYRDYAEQAEIYAQGRSKPGKIVTYARPGDSWHNHRRAFDFVVINNGRMDWNDTKSFKKAQGIGKECGLEPLNFELAHLQDRAGMTIKQAKERKNGAPAAAVSDTSMVRIQEALNAKGANPPLVVDGVPGKRTTKAIRDFQVSYLLTVDGIVGAKTRAALGL